MDFAEEQTSVDESWGRGLRWLAHQPFLVQFGQAFPEHNRIDCDGLHLLPRFRDI